MGALKIKELEKEIQQYWEEKNIPGKWRSWSEGKPVFAFLEGPPTANGFPHVGHIRGRIYKDFVLKYYRLKGYNVWAQAGWDEQGLPVEVEVEKKLGVKRKKEINERIGLEKFVKECYNLVNYYLKFWEEYATRRIALWLDLENAYETRKAKYLEHVWYLIKKAWEEGLLYEGYRVLPFCPRCETALSDAEVDQGYEEKVSPSIYVKFKLEGRDKTYLIIWTTTPWTLVDNEAVAVHPEGEYCEVSVGDEVWIIVKQLISDVMNKAGIRNWRIIKEIKGSELEGVKYIHPLLDEVPMHREHTNAHKVITADFVSLEEGTGLVHIAPGHGPEDFEVGLRYNLPVTSNVEINGVFNNNSGIFSGLDVDTASKKVIEILKSKGLLVHAGSIRHSYPHCWRCHTPLIYRADKQWFLKVEVLRNKLLEALSTVKIYPEKLRARFENWLANIRDWTISRSRIWGTPLPVWKCVDDPRKVIVIGSVDELKEKAAKLPDVDDDFLVHRPWIDQVELKVGDCSKWVREPYVVDVWMDSGVAWFAGVDGLRNRELFSKLYPYNFITEGIDQTRGWFYSLLVTSVLLMGSAPYREILMQGLVLDKYGRKMTKHLGNVVWAKDLLDKYGADPVRLYILTKYPPGDPFSFDEDEVKESLSKLNIIWNIFKFAATYMSIDKFNPKVHTLDKMLSEAKIEDKWILSRVNTVVRKFEEYMKRYELHKASREIVNFFIEDLSHGYLRLVRPRVWREEDHDKYVVYAVLYYVLKKALKVLSLIVPYFSEALWLKFFRVLEPNAEESIHLSTWESAEDKYIDEELEELFSMVFAISSSVASLRNSIGVKLRWPISEVVVVLKDKSKADLLERASSVLAFLGNAKSVIITVKSEKCLSEDYVAEDAQEYTVCIPRKLDRDLYLEALAREVIRRVQVMRNKLNLNIEEYIIVGFKTSDSELAEAIGRFKNYIMSEVRAKELTNDIYSDMYTVTWSIEGKKIVLGIRRGK